MTTAVESAGLTFLCDDPLEVWRAQTLKEKEPGTIAWLDRLQPGDVFYDVGANIGVYSLYAANRGAKVYAFEPHAINALHLARNAKQNGLDIAVFQAIVTNGGDSWLPYRYRSERAGSAGAALFDNYRVAPTVYTRSVRLDDFIIPRAPAYVKVDTDGDEQGVVASMSAALLRGFVTSLQIEVSPGNCMALAKALKESHYHPVHVHYTSQGQQALDRGADPATVVNNTIFEARIKGDAHE